MSAPEHVELVRMTVLDELDRCPVFPYQTFRAIESRAEIPDIVQDEVQKLGPDSREDVASYHDLLWFLHKALPYLATTHSSCGVVDIVEKPQFETAAEFGWARFHVLSDTVMIFRDDAGWLNPDLHRQACRELFTALKRRAPRMGVLGKAIGVRVAPVRFETTKVRDLGWGVFLGIGGFGQSEAMAVHRWGDAVRFVGRVLKALAGDSSPHGD